MSSRSGKRNWMESCSNLLDPTGDEDVKFCFWGSQPVNMRGAFNPWEKKFEFPSRHKTFERSTALWCKWTPCCFNKMGEKFNVFPQNKHLSFDTKRAVLKAFPKSVVCIESYFGGELISQRSGFIIESSETCSIILTASPPLDLTSGRPQAVEFKVYLYDGRLFDGKPMADDSYYGIAAISIQPGELLQTVSLTKLKDSLTLDPREPQAKEENSCPLGPFSNSFNIIPGDLVIALGRYKNPFNIMAAPGEFSVDRCWKKCKELFKASCIITKNGIGGPLINRHGGVIGVCLHEGFETAVLPINVASMWWQLKKKKREAYPPRLGMELTNLYAAPIEIIERITGKNSDVWSGLIVEKVLPCYSAATSGILEDDLITHVESKRIQSSFELLESIWNKVGQNVVLTVRRANAIHKLTMTVKGTREVKST